MIQLLIKRFVKNYEDTENAAVRAAYASLSAFTCILLNLLLAAGKFAVGLLIGAISITADAFNNLSDAASSLLTLFGFKLAAKPVDAKHPFGHGRLEHITGLVVSLLIMLVGGELILSSVEGLIANEASDPLSNTLFFTSIGVLLAAILVKLWMFSFNRRIGKQIESSAITATALDSVSDAVATSVALVGTVLARLLPAFPFDEVAGLFVALFILYTGFRSVREIVDQLLGMPPDAAFVQKIRETVLSFPMVVGIHDIMVHDYGPGRRMIALHAEVNADNDILEAHDVIDNIEQRLGEVFHCHAIVHMDPILINDPRVMEAQGMVSRIVTALDPAFTIHDFRMNEGSTHRNLIFDVSVTHETTLTPEEIRTHIEEEVRRRDPRANIVATVEYPFV